MLHPRTAFKTRQGGIYFSTLEAGAEDERFAQRVAAYLHGEKKTPVLATLLGLRSIGFGNGWRLFDRMRRELMRKVRTEKRERGEGEWPSPRFSLAAPKRKPRRLTDGRGFGAQALNGAQALCGEL